MYKGTSIQIGDMGFTRGKSLLNKLTLWVGGENALATHSFKFYNKDQIVQALIKTGVALWDWGIFREILAKEEQEYCVLTRTIPLLLEEELRTQFWIETMKGWQYSKSELVLAFFDSCLSKIFRKNFVCFRKLGDICQTRVICSKVANRPDVKLGYLPRKAYYWTPQETYTYMLSTGKWQIIETSPHW